MFNGHYSFGKRLKEQKLRFESRKKIASIQIADTVFVRNIFHEIEKCAYSLLSFEIQSFSHFLLHSKVITSFSMSQPVVASSKGSVSFTLLFVLSHKMG